MKKPARASLRVAETKIKKYASEYLPEKKRRRVEKILKESRNVWNAVRSMYNIGAGNVSARNVVSTYFHPTVRKYDATKNRFVTGEKANRVIKRSIVQKNIANMLMPLHGVQRGGVSTVYVLNAIKNANVKYALVNESGKRLRAFALLKNRPDKSRYINVISAFTSYGHPMMNKVVANAKTIGKRRVNLKAVVTNNKNPNNDPLVKWYAAKGFKRSGNYMTDLLPMSHNLKL
jgi:hypothetical protein